MGSEVLVRELLESEYDAWHRLVAESAEGSIYSTTQYLDVLCVAGGGRYRIAGVWLGDELAGGIALYEQKRWYGTHAGPRLLLYYHSPVLGQHTSKYPSQVTARQLRILGALAEYLPGRGYAGLTLKLRSTISDTRAFVTRGWKCSPSYTYVVPIGDLEAQWTQVEQNLRRLVRRAESHGLVFTDDDDFDAFYALHTTTMRHKRAGQYLSKSAFRTYFQGLRSQDLCRLYHARLPEGRSVAAQLVLLGPSPTTHTVTAGADPEFSKLGSSAFLRWKAFEALAALGFKANDLTDAALNPVTHFKSQLGGNLELCHVLQYPPSRRHRLGQRIERGGWRARGLVGRVVRRVAPQLLDRE